MPFTSHSDFNGLLVLLFQCTCCFTFNFSLFLFPSVLLSSYLSNVLFLFTLISRMISLERHVFKPFISTLCIGLRWKTSCHNFDLTHREYEIEEDQFVSKMCVRSVFFLFSACFFWLAWRPFDIARERYHFKWTPSKCKRIDMSKNEASMNFKAAKSERYFFVV